MLRKIFKQIILSHNERTKQLHSVIHVSLLFWVLLFLLPVIFIHGCGIAQPIEQPMIFKGRITVSDSIDASGDYSRISLEVVRTIFGQPSDTLLTTYTNIEGEFNETIMLSKSGYHTLNIARWGNSLYSTAIILAPNDTLIITGTLPDIQNNIILQSKEYQVMNSLERLNVSYNKVLPYIHSNKLSDNEVSQEWNKRAKLYWDLYQKHKGTMAAGIAAKQSLLFTLDENLLQKKYDTLAKERYYPTIVALMAKDILLPNRSLKVFSDFMDSLKHHSLHQEDKTIIDIEHISVLQDQSELTEAIDRTDMFLNQNRENQFLLRWGQRKMYDINHLSSGLPLPKITFELNDSMNTVISNESFLEHISILEFTLLNNPIYLEQYDRAYLIYNLFQNDNFKIYTIPFDDNDRIVDSFIEHYAPFWNIASTSSVKIQRNELVRIFNIVEFPVRIIVNRQGKIIKKITGNQFNDNQIIQYLKQEIPKNE